MIKYTILDFVCRFEEQAILAGFKGNIIRGALGNSLRKICCPIKRMECEQCILAANCIYFFIFESKQIKRPHLSPSTPHPFVLEPPNTDKIKYESGDEFIFRLILLNDAIKWIPYIVYATINMGEMGIGKGRKNGFGKFKLKSVKQDGIEIYQSESKELIPVKTDKYLDLHKSNTPTNKLQVNFLTPYRVKFRNSLATTFDFSILIRAALRRISNLENTFSGKEPDVDYRGLVKRSQDVQMTCEEKRWVDLTRFSFRQKSKMKLGGLVGRAIYKGELTEFYPLLKYIEIVHVGKQTSFGFGKIKVTVLE